MGVAFTQAVDIANRALQRCGAKRIFTLTDVSKNAQECAFLLDKVRQAELRRRVWRFGVRRCALRAITTTTKRMIAPAWSSAGVSYVIGSIVQDANGVYWVCMVAHTSTTANGPGSYQAGQLQNWQQWFGPVYGDTWSSSVTYSAGELVYTAGSPDAWYLSLINGNLNNTVGTAADWAPVVSTGTTDQALSILQPVGISGSGAVQINTRNRYVYMLPNGFLRLAPDDPKVENTPNLTTSAGLHYKDWELEGNYLVSNTQSTNTAPLMMRFVGDLQDVTAMDPLFCEAWAARLAYELCETITGSNVKLQAIGAAYTKFMKDASLVNRLELASTENPEEEFDLTQGPAGVQEAPAGAGMRGGGGELSPQAVG